MRVVIVSFGYLERGRSVEEIPRKSQMISDPELAPGELTATPFLVNTALALTREIPLLEVLQACAQNMVDYLNATAARIWVLSETTGQLELRANAGLQTNLENNSSVPMVTFRIPRISTY